MKLKQQIIELHRKGMTKRQIATALGVRYQHVHRLLTVGPYFRNEYHVTWHTCPECGTEFTDD